MRLFPAIQKLRGSLFLVLTDYPDITREEIEEQLARDIAESIDMVEHRLGRL